MTWRAINPTNAIERVRVVVKFRENIPSKLSRQMSEMLGKKRHDVRLDGPSPVNSINFGFQVTPDGQQLFSPPQPGPQGWQFVRQSTNGQVIELLAVEGDHITYETTDYRRWPTFLQRFERISSDLLSAAMNSLDLEIVSLEYLDRFYFDGPPSDASPTILLPHVTSFIHPDAASGLTLWHTHRGWFEKRGAGQVLVNQNFDAADLNMPSRAGLTRSVSVLTKADLRAASYPMEDIPMTLHLEFLHSVTNSYFKEALSPGMYGAVGMVS
jgi:uncharacterized protein (TIGR04255 family)